MGQRAGESDGRRAKGEATRAALVEAATRLFAAQGYSATSLAAISAETGIKTASIYHAFGSKEGLLQAVMRQASEDMFADIGGIIAQAPVRERLAHVSDMLSRRPEFLRLFLLLTLERRDGDPAILTIVEGIRTRARRMVGAAIGDLVVDVPEPDRRRILDEFARMTLILLDGAFLSRQIDGEADHTERTMTLMIAALEGVLARLLQEAAERSGP